MADVAHVKTDKKIAKVEKQIDSIYSEAQADIERKLREFNEKYKVKEAIHQKELSEGKITQADYDNWVRGQVFQGKQWEAKRDQIINTINNANVIASRVVDSQAFNVFTFNANYQSYTMEHGKGIDFGFGVYDGATVTRLIKDNPNLLPKWKVDEPKDYIWNKKKVNNAITQGIIQGERLDQITNRISDGLSAQNKNTMKTFARTTMTGAQNAGRNVSMTDASSKGIKVVKEWMSTLDMRTRHSHRMMDGEKIPVPKDIWHPTKFSNGCRYPGDPEGPPWEVYNCRCTMVGDIEDYPDEYERYDNIDGKPIKNMTYKEWYKAKYGKELKPKTPKVTPKVDYSKYGGVKSFETMRKYKDYDEFLTKSSSEDFDVVWTALGDLDKVEAAYKNAGKDFTTANKVAKTASDSSHSTKELPRVAKYIDDLTSNVLRNSNNDSILYKCETHLDTLALKYGVDTDKVKEAINNGLSKIVGNSDFVMRINSHDLEKVINDGYFKNQFETGSSGGAYLPDTRKKLENKIFNVPIDGIADADRPVYGMFAPSYDSADDDIKEYYMHGPGSWYGNGVTVMLKKPNVIQNATMTYGDSLDYKRDLVGTEVSNPQFSGTCSSRGIDKIYQLGVDNVDKDEISRIMMDITGSEDKYFEYQLHGKDTHSIDNIEKVYINAKATKYDSLIKLLDAKGIPWEYINNF